jgi:hypothetical protein
MIKRLSILILSFVVAAFAAGCSKTPATAENTTQPGPDNSEITTKVDENGVKTEERVFRDNPKVARVVVTTRNGTRTVKVYSPRGEEREIKNNDEDVLHATGDKVAAAAGWVADKGEDVAGAVKDAGSATKEKAEPIVEKTADTAKNVGEKTADGAKKVGEKTVDGAKTVGEKTVSGTKKVGKAVKKIIP